MSGTPLARPMGWAIVGQARTVEELQAAIDGTTHANVAQIRAGGVPPLYVSGVVYERETRANAPRGVERFQTANDAYNLGHSDCDGLAPWRAAECIVAGEKARAKVVKSAVGYHVVVEREDGSIEDPSARLGMLDGYGLGDATDARPTARARRRRFMVKLANKTQALLGTAATLTGAPQRAVLSQARAAAVALRGFEAQSAADGEPPLSDSELASGQPEDVAGLRSRIRSMRATMRAGRAAQAAQAAPEAPPEPEAPDSPEAPPCECVGAVAIPERRGTWPFEGYPPSVILGGKRFERSLGRAHFPDTRAHYRQDIPRNSEHLYVLGSGQYVVHHADAYNPHAGVTSAVKHELYDVAPHGFEPVAGASWLDVMRHPTRALEPARALAPVPHGAARIPRRPNRHRAQSRPGDLASEWTLPALGLAALWAASKVFK